MPQSNPSISHKKTGHRTRSVRKPQIYIRECLPGYATPPQIEMEALIACARGIHNSCRLDAAQLPGRELVGASIRALRKGAAASAARAGLAVDITGPLPDARPCDHGRDTWRIISQR